MTIPKEIYKAALGAACDHKAQPIVDDFMLGVEWVFHFLKQETQEKRDDDLMAPMTAEEYLPILRSERDRANNKLEIAVEALQRIKVACKNDVWNEAIVLKALEKIKP